MIPPPALLSAILSVSLDVLTLVGPLPIPILPTPWDPPAPPPLTAEEKALAENPDYVQTRVSDDLALVGPGYFVIRDALGEFSLCRCGWFRRDELGYFVNTAGLRLQGWMGDRQEAEDLNFKFGGEGFPQLIVTHDGTVRQMVDGTAVLEGRIAVWGGSTAESIARVNEDRYEDESIRRSLPRRNDPRFNLGRTKVFQGWNEQSPIAIRVWPSSPNPARDRAVHPVLSGLAESLLLDGPAFFVVRDPISGQTYLTRKSVFRRDAENFLVTADRGYRLLLNSATQDLQDLHLGPDSRETAEVGVASWNVDLSGQLTLRLFDGSEVMRGTVHATRILQPDRLVDAGDGYFFNDPSLARDEAPFAPHSDPRQETRLRMGELDYRALGPSECRTLQAQCRFVQHAIIVTGGWLDASISGSRVFFILRARGSSRLELTRNGDFRRSSEGYVENAFGDRVQGVLTGSNGLSDIRVPIDHWCRISISTNETAGIVAPDVAGAERWVATLALAKVTDVTGLEETKPLQFTLRNRLGDAVEPSWTAVYTPGESRINPGSLELLDTAPLELPPLPAGAVQVEVAGSSNRALVISTSDDGSHWRPWIRRVQGGEWTAVKGEEHRFFRVFDALFDLAPAEGVVRLYRIERQPWDH